MRDKNEAATVITLKKRTKRREEEKRGREIFFWHTGQSSIESVKCKKAVELTERTKFQLSMYCMNLHAILQVKMLASCDFGRGKALASRLFPHLK